MAWTLAWLPWCVCFIAWLAPRRMILPHIDEWRPGGLVRPPAAAPDLAMGTASGLPAVAAGR
ncbi:MAG TPA: hypothetical protein VET87_09375, partial [Rubrivivax sp.]|nr:hypothetical protein [Rubrivivax sp.]